MDNIQNNKYAQVIVDIPNLDTRTFSYIIPDELQDKVKIGLPVLVPFGTQGVVNAYIVGFGNYLPEGIRAKSLYEILDYEPIFDLPYLQFLEWISNYYCCDLPTVIEAALPVKFFSKAKRVVKLKDTEIDLQKLDAVQTKIIAQLQDRDEISISFLQKKVKVPSSKFYEALRRLKRADILETKNIIDIKNQKHKIELWIKLLNKNNDNKRYQAILAKLEELGGIYKQSDFLKEAKTTLPTLKKISDSGNVEIFDKELYRNPLDVFNNTTLENFCELNFHQGEALNRIVEAFNSKDSEPLLLYGITGSGKTEVYMHAAKHVIEKGKTVIFLAPEIALASQLANRISKRFGSDKVVIWHSNISEGERFDVWEKIRRNEVQIVIGARSAIFAPVKNIGLIVVDEEHESSYKQTSPVPRYNAKDLAIERAKRNGAALVLGSATPDIVSYYAAINTNRVLMLPERYGDKSLARVVIVDMKKQYESRNKGIFSRPLKQAVNENLENKRQTLLLINRRGFSTYVYCNSCGYSAECPKCSIPLILHKFDNKLRCHYCNHEESIFTICPKCGSDAIRHSGMGTQRVEEEFRKEFPTARVARLDSDIMGRKNAHIEILKQFENGEIDVLVGTQMIAKGLDIPNVTLVGVLNADGLFNLPDYRSSERGLQLLTQVAGRAGRGNVRGIVYFQTFNPDMYAIRTAKEQDYLNFYYEEIQNRYEFSYPPYSKIIRLILSSKNEIKARKYAQELAYKLDLLTSSRGIEERLEVLGPSACIISKLKDEYRFQVLIKNRLGEKGHFMITNFLKQFLIADDIRFLTDIDPSDML